ncbi:GNAT family N-acetyltransferase [Mesorhizobium sp. BR1-1-9]|uniref:GNAT family N-acetyltransferase n=1 Tax=unclassified Mesorhizobium TaxID=325217 RepID=UPI00112793AC|nr:MULTISPECIES: GNAT family N-acetyltransferase [unclassified Mesorhizobium]MBZ9810685.1 GNAT family N-acetyltransferase [Mesorhizobium sp. ESP-6-2]MBZ9871208.1 GNAT family N-acetyltransferase [Mesorhizobium sp. BR1-1-9]MBZ9943740.1 GNAT family N-acetyltransferase [Mesorhizobium sp. BR1-1-13]TPM33938.1 GNAT family N-acetyltransferase [Mesorhizobium sp. B2-2-2]
MTIAGWNPGSLEIKSGRLSLKLFTPSDANELFACITPAITRFMQWQPPRSTTAFAEAWQSRLKPILDGSDLHFVVRCSRDDRCLGLLGLHATLTACPELGIWIREEAQGKGIGREAIAAVVAWASEKLEPDCFEYPVAEENVASRRIAEHLGGSIAGRRPNSKYVAVVYRIPRLQS